jgi:hypothetical protein
MEKSLKIIHFQKNIVSSKLLLVWTNKLKKAKYYYLKVFKIKQNIL